MSDLQPLVPPHGGELTPVAVPLSELEEATRRASALTKIRMSSRETSDLIMMSMGAFSPLTGFMTKDDYTGVVQDMHLANGTLWPIPITLSITSAQAETISEGDEVALVDDDSKTLMGLMTVADKYTYDKTLEAKKVFGTDDSQHPGVAKLNSQGDVLIGGLVKAISELDYPDRFPKYYARPAETRKLFEERGWKTIAAFQTRNPIHRSHEYCTKIALEICDGLLIHPIVGKLKTGDIPADTRMKCYEILLANYYPADRAVCKVYPMEMRYGGPKEAVLHAIIRQNFGCTHLIVGRDHAGVGSYYGPFDAQDIFDEFGPDELNIKPVKIDWTFWCSQCNGMASTKTCPHPNEDHIMISGTKLREMLSNGERPPSEFSRPEVVDILMEYYAGS